MWKKKIHQSLTPETGFRAASSDVFLPSLTFLYILLNSAPAGGPRPLRFSRSPSGSCCVGCENHQRPHAAALSLNDLKKKKNKKNMSQVVVDCIYTHNQKGWRARRSAAAPPLWRQTQLLRLQRPHARLTQSESHHHHTSSCSSGTPDQPGLSLPYLHFDVFLVL